MLSSMLCVCRIMLEIKPCIALHFVEIVSQQHNCKQTVNGTEQSTHTSQIIQNLGIKGASAWYPNCLVWAHPPFLHKISILEQPLHLSTLGYKEDTQGVFRNRLGLGLQLVRLWCVIVVCLTEPMQVSSTSTQTESETTSLLLVW